MACGRPPWTGVESPVVCYGLYTTELIRRRWPWLTVEQVELATLKWVWWWNNQRLHSELGYRTPTEVEGAYCADLETPETANAAPGNHPERNPGRIKSFVGALGCFSTVSRTSFGLPLARSPINGLWSGLQT